MRVAAFAFMACIHAVLTPAGAGFPLVPAYENSDQRGGRKHGDDTDNDDIDGIHSCPSHSAEHTDRMDDQSGEIGDHALPYRDACRPSSSQLAPDSRDSRDTGGIQQTEDEDGNGGQRSNGGFDASAVQNAER